MGPVIRRLLFLTPGLLAVAVALALGARLPYAAAALALFALATPLGPRLRTLALLLAPLVLAMGAPLPSLLSLSALVWLVLALLAAAPIYLFLGARIPLRGLALWLPLALVLLLPALFAPWAPSYFFSDVATRSQVALLIAASLLLSGAIPHIPLPKPRAEAGAETYEPLLGPGRPKP